MLTPLARWMMFSLAVAAFATPPARGQTPEEEIVQAAAMVLNQTLATPLNQIPETMLADAHGVAIIPNVIKGGFIVGARHGRGLLFVRESDGSWRAPVFITLTGGNVGWQVGVQSSDIVLVFKTPRSVQNILNGKLTIGADAAAAAGPVGRQGSVGTDSRLQAEIYSYSRSRGLFVGLSIDGSVVRVDPLGTGAYYRSPGPGLPPQTPEAAEKLTAAIASYAGGGAKSPTSPAQAPHQYGVSEQESLRRQLIERAPRLYDLLDESWKAYLALPAEIYLQAEPVPDDKLRATLARFESVAAEPRYQQLARRPEFQSVYGLLRQYELSHSANPSGLQLPPPPAAGGPPPR